ncbi:hypothetical protein [Streptosporangium sp. NPDC087985]|uniref:hypothetical protein n=1 Tax=Streptosporangium sp. NPDC087985 TaxID=3366196 RepID=UPI0037F9FC80
MRQDPNSSPTRSPARWIAWLFGAMASLIALAVLLWVIGVHWFFWSVSSHLDENEKWDLAKIRQQAVEVESRLRAAAADGKLADAEIDKAAERQPWHVNRSPEQIQIVVRMISTTAIGPRCFTYTLIEPLGSGRVIRDDRERLTCSEAVYHPEFRN